MTPKTLKQRVVDMSYEYGVKFIGDEAFESAEISRRCGFYVGAKTGFKLASDLLRDLTESHGHADAIELADYLEKKWE